MKINPVRFENGALITATTTMPVLNAEFEYEGKAKVEEIDKYIIAPLTKNISDIDITVCAASSNGRPAIMLQINSCRSCSERTNFWKDEVIRIIESIAYNLDSTAYTFLHFSDGTSVTYKVDDECILL